MPRLTLTLEPELLEHLAHHKPKRQSLSAFCADLIEQNLLGLDRASRLPAYRVGAGTPDTSKGFSDFDSDLGRSDSDVTVSTAVEAVDQPKINQSLEPKKNQHANFEIDQLVDQLLVTPRERGTNPKANDTNSRAQKDAYSKRHIDADLVPADLLDCQQLLPEFWAAKKGTRSERVWSRVCRKLREWTPELRREALERAIASGWGDVFEPPAARASSGQSTGYVDSITRDRIEREKFLAMFSTEEGAA